MDTLLEAPAHEAETVDFCHDHVGVAGNAYRISLNRGSPVPLWLEARARTIGFRRDDWLFFGSEEAGERSAVMYTLAGNCRMHGVEPYAYLKDVLERLPRTTNREVAELTPLNWKRAREKSLKQAA